MSAIELGASLDLAKAKSRVAAAMAEAHTAMRAARSERRVAGWLQREDGSWSLVDELGHIRPPFAYGPYDEDQDDERDDVFADADAALAAVGAHIVVDVEPLYSPGLRHILEVAERIARDRGAQTVEIDDLELALAGRGQGGESPGRHPQ